MAGSSRQHHPGPAGRGDRQADRRGHDRAGHRGRGGVPAVSGAEPAVLGLCGPGADGPDAGGHPGEVLRHRRRRRPGPAGAVHPGPGRGAHRHPPDGQRLGVQLAEVLQAPGDRPAPLCGARVDAGRARPGGPQPPVPQPRPHLRHRLPRLHPALPGGGGGAHAPRPARAGPGLRQRHPLHRRPVPGGGIRRRGGH